MKIPKLLQKAGEKLMAEATEKIEEILIRLEDTKKDAGDAFSFLMALDTSPEGPSLHGTYGPCVLAIADQGKRTIRLIHLQERDIADIHELEKDLEERHQVPADYYVITKDSTFIDLIDALGGVEVKGKGTLKGKEALAFAGRDPSHLLLPAFLDELTSFTGLFKLLGYSSKLKKSVASDLPKEKILEILKRELGEERSWDITSGDE
ncbi:MAG: hypothetical protein IIZ47_01675, partial [Erysipelotrichaceae bacterium]|nr:hypothetical protein [Erysipelotrichaceae bacterium]